MTGVVAGEGSTVTGLLQAVQRLREDHPLLAAEYGLNTAAAGVEAALSAAAAGQAEAYLITWQIDSDAASPVAAAQEAWAHMRREDSIANAFEVRDRAGHVVMVDLSDLPNRIPDLADVSEDGMKRWFQEMNELGLSFHPDDSPREVVHGLHGERTFTDEECDKLDGIMPVLFKHFGIRVYDVAGWVVTGDDYDNEPEGMRP